jgi:hypothetical protein
MRMNPHVRICGSPGGAIPRGDPADYREWQPHSGACAGDSSDGPGIATHVGTAQRRVEPTGDSDVGALVFYEMSAGQTAEKAFANAVAEARREYGQSRFTGQVCEKREYVMVTHDLLTPEQAQAMAEELIDKRDPRIDDKWGPAGCIELTSGKYFFFGWASY